MRRARLSVFLTLALTAACGLDPATAPISSRGPLAANTSVSRRPYDPNYIEESRRVLRGVRLTNGGCGVGSVDTLQAGEHLLEWVAEYDTSTCTLTLARGRYVGPERETRKHPGKTHVDTAKVEGQAPRLAVANPLTRIKSLDPRGPLLNIESFCDPWIESAWQGYQRLITEDPFQVDVNWDRIEFEWASRPSLNCIQSAVMTHSAWSNPVTYWSIGAFWTVENYISADASYAQGWVSSQHINYWFCLPSVPTYVYYRDNKMRIFPDGHVIFEMWWDWWGDCSSLLHSDRQAAVWGV